MEFRYETWAYNLGTELVFSILEWNLGRKLGNEVQVWNEDIVSRYGNQAWNLGMELGH